MLKSDLLLLDDFSGWFDFATFIAAKQAGRRDWDRVAPPRKPGVYFFATGPLSRCRGESDIYYIGKADEGRTLRTRINDYLYRVRRSEERESYGGWVGGERASVQGIAAMVELGRPLQIGWIVTETGDDAREKETALIDDYAAQHGQLPPNNKIRGSRRESGEE